MNVELVVRLGARARVRRVLIGLACLLLPLDPALAAPQYQHGISLLHELKYPADFEHFDWVNPSAPKGGALVLSASEPVRNFSGAWGTSVTSAPGIEKTVDRLFVQAADELGALYGVLADGVALSRDRKSLYIRLHEKARWHDGVPVTTDDVRYSFEVLEKTDLNSAFILRAWLKSIEIVNEREFVIHHRDVFTQSDLGQLANVHIRPAHYYVDRDPGKVTLEPPVGSGPYRVADFDQGYVVYERMADYWGRDLPVNRGRFNFDTIRYDVYRDATITRQAIRKGLIDVYEESDILHWHTSYDDPSLRARGLVQATRSLDLYIGPRWGLAFNLSREKFSDVRVREALTLMFDFEWQNRVFHFNEQRRAGSYFSGSPFAASGLPSQEELAILEPYRDRLDERVLTQAFELPVSTGRGVNRSAMLRAHELLIEAGWTLDEGRWKGANGQALVVEVAANHGWAKRLLLPYVESLVALGVDARFRFLEGVTAMSYKRKRRFDLYFKNYDVPNPPLPILPMAFHSARADMEGAGNINAIRDPVVDDLILRAQRAANLNEATVILRALDRVLSWGFYDILLSAPDHERFVYWVKFGRPDDAKARFAFLTDGYLEVIDSWWARGSEGGETAYQESEGQP